MNAVAGHAVSHTVSAMDRFAFTLFFAAALHAVAIIGITFTSEAETPPQKTLAITLAQYQQEKPPEQADFIAQANQAGSGENAEKALPATDQQAPFQSPEVKQQAAGKPPQPAPPIPTPTEPMPTETNAKAEAPTQLEVKQPAQEVIATTKPAPKKISIQPQKLEQAPSQAAPTGASTSLLARSLEIASLQAEIDHHREAMARKPRVTRLTSASTQRRADALYLDNWRKKIEQVGNINYPEEARRQKLYGSLRLLVAINPDGSVENIEILESSGRRILDDAAIRIVQLAAPFQPFSVEMRKSTDLLEIIRTWKFEKKAYVY